MDKANKELDKKLEALFLLMMEYSDKINPLFKSYRLNRDILKAEINKIYAKYTIDNSLNMSKSEIKKEMKRLEPVLKKIGQDLYKKENDLLKMVLTLVFTETFKKTYKILEDYKDLDVIKKLSDSIINKSINTKVQDLTCFDRNKSNKEKLIDRTKKNIEFNLKKGSSIENINKGIDDNFNVAASNSKRLLDTEIPRNINNAEMEVYKDADIKKVMYNSVLEKNTCSICRSLHGIIFEIDNAPSLPLHANCKCYYTGLL